MQQAAKGTPTLDSVSGQFQYVPVAGGIGTDTVTVAANDGVSRSQGVAIEFRYPAVNRGGGGNVEWLTVMLLLAAAAVRQYRERYTKRLGSRDRAAIPR